MKTSNAWNIRSLWGKIMLGLALAAMIGSMEAPSAVAGEHGEHGGGRGGHEGRHDNGRYDHRGRGYDRGHYRDGRVYRSYGYVQPAYVEPVYVAPPVYYAPAPAPGISIFLPTIHIR